MITAPTIAPPFDMAAIRQAFPILSRQVKGHPLVYLDNAATTQKPQAVIDALTNYYSQYNANIHRGIHTLAEEATAAFEESRDTARAFINAASREEIIFTRGATEGINLVAYTWGRANIREGDEIIITGMEHHSNMVPWQLLCQERNAQLRIIPLHEEGTIIFEEYEKLLSSRTKLVAVVHVSNSLGTVNPVKAIIDAAHARGALTLVDGSQSAVHLDIDVQALDTDFFVFSGHKVYGPTGTGVLYGKKDLLLAMPPFHGGGEMIREVSYARSTFNDLPYKFEAGTPNIADAIALKAALDFVSAVGKPAIRQHEHALLEYAAAGLRQVKGLRIIGNAKDKISLVSFIIDGVHPQDAGILLDNRGIAVRTGHHCTQPLMDWYCIPGTIRASFAMYNTKEEVDALLTGLEKAVQLLA